MADIEFGDYDEDYSETTGAWQSVVNWTGALCSLALVGGLAYWGYELLVRDVTGVPVVRALEGPMRVAPDDPGGLQAEHQGLAVNDVAAGGTATRPADTVTLAPRPIDLADEDATPLAAEVAEMTPAAEDEAPPATAVDPETLTTTSLSQDITAPDPVQAAQALADTLTEGATPLSPAPEPEAVEEPKLKLVPASVPGVKRSPRPTVRPEGDLAARAALAAVNARAEAKPEEIAATAVAAGSNLVQLGAFDSAEVARSEWQRLSSRFASFLQGKQRVVQRAESGGRIFYRLRAAGFSDIADARQFCAALTAERADCIPVVAR
ncbi:SPOR domain-containing protein [Actibacterium ureilyticum]|uniref:SPOR domain-containing protein n=1 Tax=Actibacterium ureilyticum TaxID=1590614 RepID=UPI000BAAC912|nr:SPOR domain-containing protein [Actibacterium ureilyticum]